jgi:hypothetical protein
MILNEPDDALKSLARCFLDRYSGELFMMKFAHGLPSAIARGARDAIQDAGENAPFGSVGGLAKRDTMVVPDYVLEQECSSAAYLAGYQEAARRMYGEDWRDCSFGWVPVIVLTKELLGEES